MRISILSILLVLVMAIAGPLAFAETDALQDQVAEQGTEPSSEALTEAPGTAVEIMESVDAEGAKEDCANGADDDGDEKIDCEDPDCAGEAGCKSGY